ncbi:hypothetical protein [Chitinolyticbacter albus]|uniref:hypothetical protein n=1 Tax=Chitinolyticbacter albus TaxID=2961951 RepID=UPI002108BB59|nr:hypothetical protein [Chitinolyticbacter albus]
MRNRPRFCLPVLALCFALSAVVHAATYRGHIGKQAVVVELFEQGSELPREGRYAYLAHGQILLLESGGEPGLLTEYRGRSSSDDEAISGYWQLQRDDNGWQGRWLKQPGERGLPITLQPASLPNETLALLHLLDGENVRSGFDLLLAASPARKLRSGEVRRMAGTAVLPQHWQRGQLRVEGFLLAKPEQTGDARINALLQLQLQDAIGEAEQCEVGAPRGLSDYVQVDTPSYASTHYLSVATLRDYFCGGAYPSAGSTARVYDRRSGQLVGLATEVYQVDDAKQTAFRKLVAHHLKSLVSAEEAECYADFLRNPNQADAPWLYLNGIEANGVIVSLGYPQVAKVCEISVTLPYASMQPFLRPESRHDFVKQH